MAAIRLTNKDYCSIIDSPIYLYIKYFNKSYGHGRFIIKWRYFTLKMNQIIKRFKDVDIDKVRIMTYTSDHELIVNVTSWERIIENGKRYSSL